jgi:molybdopterin biosynthesis enzyme MoaB
MPWDGARRVARAAAAGALLACVLGGAVPPEFAAVPETGDTLAVTGQVVYGKADGARTAAVVDILAVYANNPIYMRMKAEGLSETDGKRGSKLFADSQAATNKALAKVAREVEVDVVTVPGGVKGGERPIPDLTQKVIDKLPVYHVEGKVVSGNVANARLIAELDSAALLNAIPAWREAQKLTANDVDYHLLRKRAQEQFEAAVKKAAGEGNYDAVVERGGVTSRLGPVADITPAAMAALAP